MNTTWQGLTQLTGVGLSNQVQQFLAQSSSLQTETSPISRGVADVQGVVEQLILFTPRLLGSAVILLVGWLIAAIASKAIEKILNRTNIDNRIAAGITGSQDAPQIEKLISGLVFWSIFLLTVVAVLQNLGLEVASRPLNNFLNQLIGFLPQVVGAGIILGVAWFLATIVRLLTVRTLRTLRFDERLSQENQDGTPSTNQLSLSETIGNALYWFIFLLFLGLLLETLGLQEALLPVQALTTEILSVVPNILAAILIGTVGWFIANIVQRIVTNLLHTTGIDHVGSRFGLSPAAGVQSLSKIIGTIVYILILIPVAIASLNALKIEAISAPAIVMLQQVLNTLPSIFTAAGILIVSYFLGRFVSELVTTILTSLGFNNIFTVLGLPSLNQQAVYSEQPTAPTRTPSEVAGIIVLVGIMLFATVAAVNILNIPALTSLVTGIVIILGRILAGLIVFAIGLFLANLAFSIISSSGNSQARVLAQVARISIIALVSAMALQQIGVAPDIVNLAFGLLFGAIAVAIALAFGLGGRDVAQEQMREWLTSFKETGNKE
ncbi:mechanosensitive ion channel [Anabaena cylindrica FACHB-243]|uniref:Conserved TM helix repeat-containing protein n=1 Tax=Anabaena cylindrica (strain ATCC 27899 / PCC 7122) TaxID=272123 RepID=K9ZI13_ANACC|nr:MULTISPECIES: mechanosensitive ion channel [Anabaena]AFZ57990.1 Conserved TM helix repeat-containing protein [Anabaena cylindrica PCC 7122]MBD2420764.1 mechanosensitive ion channel [Anabaena cylindrica FACHB-243]MBY5282720.1 mechanosensitive ion channel [Anabaena sp. CCAP 1446/1C]MBY5311177.1 mechanosensitive ion channel [Anabaena sp. CCAP 1446/1C]MCM2408216.1 mechanosensitive ion channel [Anabaena sp. CCAP 1446/1C]